MNPEPTKEEKEAKEKKDRETDEAALDFAAKLFEAVKQPDFAKFDAQTRHRTLINKYPNFAQAYPLILRYIAIEMKYQPAAFRWFLNKLRRDPGKGMDGYISCQADYARQLYIEECKARGRRVNMKTANKIKDIEYTHMRKVVKKMEEDEKKARNEFEDEERKNLEAKKEELLKFINESEDPTASHELDPELEQYERAALGLHPKSIGDIDVSAVEGPELKELLRHFYNHISELRNEADVLIDQLRERKLPGGEQRKLWETDLVYDDSHGDEVMRQEVHRLRREAEFIEELIKKLRTEIETDDARLRKIAEEKELAEASKEWLEGTAADPHHNTKKVKAHAVSRPNRPKVDPQAKKEEQEYLDKLVAEIEGSGKKDRQIPD